MTRERYVAKGPDHYRKIDVSEIQRRRLVAVEESKHEALVDRLVEIKLRRVGGLAQEARKLVELDIAADGFLTCLRREGLAQ